MKIFKKIYNYILFRLKYRNNLEYWNERVEKYGDKSVLNGNNMDYELSTTERQVDIIFPIIKENLIGNEKIILDYGCGPGRFTKKLASLIDGEAIGVDPMIKLLQKSEINVKYFLLKDGIIPIANNYIDVIFICLVLGGIEDKYLMKTKSEINRVIKANGLIVIIEKIVNKEKNLESHWKGRTADNYQKLFDDFNLKLINTYIDCNETIGIFVGRYIK